MSNQKKFDAGSPGFLYSIVVLALTVFAVSGLNINPDETAREIVTSLSNGGVYAIIGIIASSVIFPIWNFFKRGGKVTLKVVFGSVLTWVALGNALFAVIALTGFTIPEGTVEQIVGFIQAKDWTSLIAIVFANVLNPLIRFIKDKRSA